MAFFYHYWPLSRKHRIDPIALPCSVSRMLAASDSAPNSHQQTPRPGNWRGVSEGMSAAHQAAIDGRFEDAETLLLELLEFAPVEIRAWKLLAKVQRQLGHIEQGIRSATRALQLQNNPLSDEAPISITLARLLWEQHEYEEAKAMLQALIAEQPEHAELLTLQQQWNMETTE